MSKKNDYTVNYRFTTSVFSTILSTTVPKKWWAEKEDLNLRLQELWRHKMDIYVKFLWGVCNEKIRTLSGV